MAVLIEARSVVVRLESIAEKYPGGIDQYIEDCPNRNFCMDEEIARVGFMVPADMTVFIEDLVDLGFKYVEDHEFVEIAIVDQFDGVLLPCDWLEYLNLVIFEGDIRVAICKMKGGLVGNVCFPAGWDYEYSLSKRTITVDSDNWGARLTFLRSENGLDFYHDTITDKEVFIDRSARRDMNA